MADGRHPGGRPKGSGSKKTTALVDLIIAEISTGKPLRQICRENDVGATTVYDWMDEDPEFAVRFARAREIGFDALADEVLEIADKTDEEAASRRVRTEARLKLLAKWDPKRYGDAMQLKHADAEGDKLDIGGPIAVAMRAASLLKTALDRANDGPDES